MKTQYSLEMTKVCVQCEKKVVFDIPGMEDFAIVLVNSLLNLPDGEVEYFKELNFHWKTVTVKSILLIKKCLGLVEMTFG